MYYCRFIQRSVTTYSEPFILVLRQLLVMKFGIVGTKCLLL